MESRAKAFGGDGSLTLELASEKASGSTSLIWYVNPDSFWPVWLQYCYLWCKRTVFRRPLE